MKYIQERSYIPPSRFKLSKLSYLYMTQSCSFCICYLLLLNVRGINQDNALTYRSIRSLFELQCDKEHYQLNQINVTFTRTTNPAYSSIVIAKQCRGVIIEIEATYWTLSTTHTSCA